MKKSVSTVVLIGILLAGMSLLLYPSLSDWWNSLHATQVVADYNEDVQRMDHARYEKMWQDAVAYNKSLVSRDAASAMTEEEMQAYQSLLNVGGTGIMGYIDIPSIGQSLPIYHGTEESVLQVAVGHIAWSSLPTGGESTHCVLSGHSGLPSAKLFTNLERLEKGDTFNIRVLDKTLYYEVDQILVVEPEDVSALEIEDRKDLCTLVTCTPYGVNTHRLLVRGHRISEPSEEIRAVSDPDMVQMEPLIVIPVAVTILLLTISAVLLVSRRRKKTYRR